jgi:hypothetical protein
MLEDRPQAALSADTGPGSDAAHDVLALESEPVDPRLWRSGDGGTMSGVRRRVTIVGPGPRGFLRAHYQLDPDETVAIDVRTETLPPDLRLPNTTFVGFIIGRDLVRVEADGEAWLEIQNRIRDVLNQQWDPIGVADIVGDEYDGYIGEIHGLLKSGASLVAIAEHLRSIEAVRMEVRVSPREKLRSVVESLQRLELPDPRR